MLCFDALFWRFLRFILTLYFDALFWRFILTLEKALRTNRQTLLTLESLRDWKVESYEATKTISPIKKPEKKQGIEVSCQCGNSREGKWISIPRDDEDKNELKEISNDDNEDDIKSLGEDDDYYWD